MFDQNLVHAIIGGKDLDRGSAELSVNLVLTRGHGPYSLTYNTSGRTKRSVPPAVFQVFHALLHTNNYTLAIPLFNRSRHLSNPPWMAIMERCHARHGGQEVDLMHS